MARMATGTVRASTTMSTEMFLMDDRNHQLVISGGHLLDGSGQRAFRIEPPVGCIGEERKSKGDEAPADALDRIIAEDLS